MKKTPKLSIVSTKLERKAFTVQEAADMLAVSPMTIRRSIKEGKIEAIQLSAHGRYRIHVEALDNFMRKTIK
jgi:excisionase family DNA binding protein